MFLWFLINPWLTWFSTFGRINITQILFFWVPTIWLKQISCIWSIVYEIFKKFQRNGNFSNEIPLKQQWKAKLSPQSLFGESVLVTVICASFFITEKVSGCCSSEPMIQLSLSTFSGQTNLGWTFTVLELVLDEPTWTRLQPKYVIKLYKLLSLYY